MNIEALIWFLIWVLVVAGVIYLATWVITDVAKIPIPPRVIQIVWAIFALIVVLMLAREFLPYLHKPGPILKR